MDDEVVPIFEVVWSDAWFDRDESEPSQWLDKYLVHSIGFLVRDDELVLSLAGEILPDGQYRSVTHVPRNMVVSAKEVREDWRKEQVDG